MNYRQGQPKKKRLGRYLLLGLLLLTVVAALCNYFLWTEHGNEVDPDVKQIIQEINEKNDNELSAEAQVGRLSIFDRNMQPLALSFPLISVYLRPLEMKKRTQDAADLAVLLDLNTDELQKKLRSERSFVWLKKNIDQKIARQIADLQYDGVYLVRDSQRVFPEGSHASHVIGFVKEEQGLAGSEFYYDSILRGDMSHGSVDLSSAGINLSDISDRGASVVLTIDLALQNYLEKKLQKLLKELNGKSAMAAVIDTATGELLALTNQPSFNPNIYWQYDSFERRNRIVTDPLPVGGFSRFFLAALEIANGNLPKSLLFPEEVAERIISPRNLKQWRSAKKPSVINWLEVSAESYIYPSVTWPDQSSFNPEKQNEFCEQMGLNLTMRVDLPGSINRESVSENPDACVLADSKNMTTGMNLLTTYAEMVNGGKKILPHVLSGLWSDEQKRFIKADFASDAEVHSSEVSSDFIRFIKSLYSLPEQAVVLESVVVHEDQAVGIEVERKDGGEAEPESLPLSRFDVVTLAANAPEGNLAVVLIVEGAAFDLQGSSPLKKVALNLLRKSKKINKINPDVIYTKGGLDSTAINKVWSEIHQKKVLKSRYNTITQSDKMPDVTGLSLRKALRILQDYRLRVTVQGAGAVVSQYPIPGRKIKEGTECQLKLSRTAYQ